MAITHHHARRLIQLRMDETLGAQDSANLLAHLHSCSECAIYAREISEVAELLMPLMKRQLRAQPIPLSIDRLVVKREKESSRTLLAMRTAAVSLFIVTLIFSTWTFVARTSMPTGQPVAAIPPVPTPLSPAANSTSLHLTLEGCPLLSYSVHEQDTLASIAKEFSVAESTIVDLNQLEAGTVEAAMELTIPLCPFTPTGTLHAATFTSTLTPVLNYRTSTPGG